MRNHRRVRVVACVICIFGLLLFATTNASSQVDSVSTTAKPEWKYSFGNEYVTFNGGYDADKGGAATIKGQYVGVFAAFHAGKRPIPGQNNVFGSKWYGGLYAAATVDGGWSTTDVNNDQLESTAEFGLANIWLGVPTIDDPAPWHSLPSIALEAKGRYAEYDADSSRVALARQYLLGAKIRYRCNWTWLNSLYAEHGGELPEAPVLSLGYLKVHQGEVHPAFPLPDQLKADQLYFRVEGNVPLPILGSGKWALLNVLWHLSSASEGTDKDIKSYVDLSLSEQKTASVKPIISYREGTRDGLRYDGMVILGLVFDLFGSR